MDKLIQKYCEKLKVTEKQVKDNGRKGDLVLCKHVICYLLLKNDFRTTAIGKRFGVTHATVLHSKRKVEQLLSSKDEHILRLFELLGVNPNMVVAEKMKAKPKYEIIDCSSKIFPELGACFIVMLDGEFAGSGTDKATLIEKYVVG